MLKFVTGNKTKVKEYNEVLSPFKVQQADLDLPEIQSLDLREILKHKFGEAFKHHQGEFIVEDSAMSMEALGGQLPGPLIKWFNETIGTQGLADIAAKFKKSRATAKTVIGFAKNPGEILYFEGEVKGKIVEPKGDYLFGYDPIFVPDGSEKTLSELKSQGDFSGSPRGIALKKLKEYLLSQNYGTE